MRVCAWCRAILQIGTRTDGKISHAICEGCWAEVREGLAAEGVRVPHGRPDR